jgi:endonuclease YncB( thermonuclease family)
MRYPSKVVLTRLSVALALMWGLGLNHHAIAASPDASVQGAGSTKGFGQVPGLAAALTPGGSWPRFSGVARVLDGDTIELAGVRVRLEGIDAPEGGQRCNRKGYGEWDCGQASSHALKLLAGGREVVCEDRGFDKYNRTLGICYTDGRDINAAMVRAGLAWAYVKYSTAYVAEEAEARTAQRGVWQAATMAPWDWRALQKRGGTAGLSASTVPQPLMTAPAVDGTAQPRGCLIKGNVTKTARIYHTPESPWYQRIAMSSGLGRRWFCSEAEAQAAGWRPVISFGAR